MYQYKLTDITFNDNTSFEPTNLTVILGPNNSGKSRILKEIARYTTQHPSEGLIVKNVQWTTPSNYKDLCDSYDLERYRDENNNWAIEYLSTDLMTSNGRGHGGDWQSEVESKWNVYGLQHNNFAVNFGSGLVAFLTTENRLQLLKEAASQSRVREISNLLQAIYQSGRKTLTEIRKLVKQSFGKDITLDYTTLQRLLFRVGDNFDQMPTDPMEANQLMLNYERLDEQGDGIRSFIGIVSAFLAVKRALFLVDEPEAFLHPPQAFRIGEFIAEQANNTRQIIVSTHSSDILRGIINKTREVQILRVERDGNINHFKFLDSERLRSIVDSPLLSSARVLDGLFYSGAVVVEADSDARFYQAVSRKMKPELDLHFVNADNKQTIHQITKVYEDMGVRCAGIVDIDVLNDSTEFNKQLESLNIDAETFKTVYSLQDQIAKAVGEIPADERLNDVKTIILELQSKIAGIQTQHFASEEEADKSKKALLRQIESRSRDISSSTKNWKSIKEKGRDGLPQDMQTVFDELFEICGDSGLFINPRGELESMLKEYAVPYTTDKKGWISQALTLIKDIEINENKYPWKFFKEIHNKTFS